MKRTLALFVFLAIPLLGSTAQAHRLKLFATLDGTDIVGQAYFGGGKYPNGMTITLTDPEGTPLGEAVTDAEGKFRFPATRIVDHVLSASTADGHAAQVRVPLGDPERPASTDPSPVEGQSPPVLESRALEHALSQSLRPMEERIQALEDAVGARDILGGLGYILGLFGLVAWFSARKKTG